MESHRTLNSRAALDYLQEHRRHWSSESEQYTSADILQQYLWMGWNIAEPVIIETIYHTNNRFSKLYHFTLLLDGKTVRMPVLATPVVFRVIEEFNLGTVATSRESSRS